MSYAVARVTRAQYDTLNAPGRNGDGDVVHTADAESSRHVAPRESGGATSGVNSLLEGGE